MNFLKKIEYLDWLVRQRSTGTAEELAEKLRISKRSVFNYLNWMKEHGAPIRYNSFRRSYEYKEEVEFVAMFVKKKIK